MMSIARVFAAFLPGWCLHGTWHRWRVGLLTGLAAVAWGLASAAQAAVVISNSPNGTSGGSSLSQLDWKALLFTTNSVASRMESLTVGLNPLTPAGLPATLKVELVLYALQGGVPAAQVATTGLQTVNLVQTQQDYTFNTGASFYLAPSTRYALVLRSDATGIKWGNTGGPSTTPTAFDGYSVDGFLGSADAGASWVSLPGINSVVVKVQNIPTIPTLSPGALVGLALLLLSGLVVQRRRAGKL